MRALSTGEVSTALRPFYFTVHPDLFGQYPTQRVRINLNADEMFGANVLRYDRDKSRLVSSSNFVDSLVVDSAVILL